MKTRCSRFSIERHPYLYFSFRIRPVDQNREDQERSGLGWKKCGHEIYAQCNRCYVRMFLWEWGQVVGVWWHSLIWLPGHNMSDVTFSPHSGKFVKQPLQRAKWPHPPPTLPAQTLVHTSWLCVIVDGNRAKSGQIWLPILLLHFWIALGHFNCSATWNFSWDQFLKDLWWSNFQNVRQSRALPDIIFLTYSNKRYQNWSVPRKNDWVPVVWRNTHGLTNTLQKWSE